MPNYPLSKKWIGNVFAGLLIVFFTTTVANGLSPRDPAYNGVWQDYGGGWSYMYLASVDHAYWKYGSDARLAYGYTGGQWYDTGIGGGWQTVGATGVGQTFIGDGVYHDMKNGWSYMYNAAIDYAYWRDGSTARFAYGYTGGQWNDTGLGGGWQRLASGLTPSFLGDGVYHDMKNGWSYMYNAAIDYAYWRDGSDARLAYGYTGGQWNDTGLGGGWQRLASGLTPSFLGDGVYHDMQNGWSYMYLASVDYAYWRNGSDARLAYGYTGGQWNDTGLGGGWKTVGTGVNPTFVGDGVYHDMNNGWSYMYYASIDYAYWRYGSAVRLAYGYSGGQWCNTGNGGGWQTLGTGVSPTFIGDGVYHDMQNGWSYRYFASVDYGEWTGGAINYRYYYGTGQWMVPNIAGTVWGNLGLPGQPASCMYDNLGNPVIGGGTPYWLTWYNNALYYSATDALHGRELWKWDGTVATLVADINKGPDGLHLGYDSNPRDLTEYNGALYFSADDGMGLTYQLWKYDGSTVTKLPNTAFLNPQNLAYRNSENVNDIIVYKNALYFSETEGVYTFGLYKYDGSTFTHFGADYYPYPPKSTPGVCLADDPQLTVFNDALYFTGGWKYEGSPGDYNLWKFDGSAFTGVGGTFGVNAPNYISNLRVSNGALYFSANDKGGASTHGQELWQCTSSDVVSRVIDLNTGNPPGSHPENSSNPSNLTDFNGALYFSANEGIDGYQCHPFKYVSSTNTVTRFDETVAGLGLLATEPFTVYNGQMLCETSVGRVYMYDGSNWFLIATNTYGLWANNPRHYGVFNGHYFYPGASGQLWQWQ